MKTLIIPDIHNKVDIVNNLLFTLEYDKVVMLGDYFDSFEPYDPELVVKSVIEWSDNNKITMLWGNHDIQYVYGYFPFGCTGYKKDMQNEIDKGLDSSIWDKFKLYTKIGDWYLSHAGMHPDIFCRVPDGISDEYIDTLCNKALECAKVGKHHIVLNAGERRGGHQKFGGITWLDFRNFEPIPGINQIVGHTASDIIRFCNGNWTNEDKGRSVNICLDTHLHHYAILENNKLTIYDIDGNELGYNGEEINWDSKIELKI